MTENYHVETPSSLTMETPVGSGSSHVGHDHNMDSEDNDHQTQPQQLGYVPPLAITGPSTSGAVAAAGGGGGLAIIGNREMMVRQLGDLKIPL